MNTSTMNLTPSIIGITKKTEEEGDYIDIICAFPCGIPTDIKESITKLLQETTGLNVKLVSLDLDIPEVWNLEEA